MRLHFRLNLHANTGGDNIPGHAVAGSQLQPKSAFDRFQAQAEDHVLATEVRELEVGYIGEHERDDGMLLLYIVALGIHFIGQKPSMDTKAGFPSATQMELENLAVMKRRPTAKPGYDLGSSLDLRDVGHGFTHGAQPLD